MATKDYSLFFKDKQNFVFKDNLNGQFNNLNLNQNNQCFAEIIQIQSSKNVENHKISNYGNTDYTFHKNDFSQTNQNSTFFEKTQLGFSFTNFNAQKNYDKKEEKILNANKSSTLSLHISAYENSINATFGDSSDGGEKDRIHKTSIKSLKAVKKLFNGSYSSENYAFELPRQQQQNQNNDPEVMQFKASQQLSNVNGASVSSNADIEQLQIFDYGPLQIVAMDKLFESDSKAYISPIINIQDFREKALAAQKNLSEYFQIPAQIRLQELQSTSESSSSNPQAADQVAAVESDCRISFKYFLNSKGIAFDEADEVINYMDDSLQELLLRNPIDNLQSSFPPADSKLKLHKALHIFRDEKNLRKVKNKYLSGTKYFNYRPGELRKGFTAPGKIAADDIVITAHLIGPNMPKKLKSETKLLLRGDMPLIKLRDKIFCAYDYFSNLQDFEDATNPEDYYLNRYPSAFIFIHDTFYIDKRNPNSQDISEPIRKYMASKKDFGPTKVADIMEYKIKDLTLRLGQPYVFIHLGDCEHILIFTDLKLLHPTDNQELDFYPVFLSDKRSSPKCYVCKSETATFIIAESDRIPYHPAFMCTSCFNAFHYDGNNRIGTFRAFHYIEHGIFE